MKKLLLVSTAILLTLSVYAQRDTSMSRRDTTNRTYRNRSDSTNRSYSSSNSMGAYGKDTMSGVMMKDHRMMLVKKGKKTVLSKDLTLQNGTKVMANGTVTKKDGSTMMLKEGDFMDMTGMMYPMKNN